MVLSALATSAILGVDKAPWAAAKSQDSAQTFPSAWSAFPLSTYPCPQEASPTQAEQCVPASREGLFSATAHALDGTVIIMSGVQKPTAAHLTLPKTIPLWSILPAPVVFLLEHWLSIMMYLFGDYVTETLKGNFTPHLFTTVHPGSTTEQSRCSVNLVCAKSLQSGLTLWNPMDCGPLGSSVHGTLQTRILEWVTMSFSRGSIYSPQKLKPKLPYDPGILLLGIYPKEFKTGILKRC